MNRQGEEKFLLNYNPENYDRVSVATDIVVFSVSSEVEENYRKLPEKTFNILMIKRGEHPYKDYWALPGGFVKADETTEDTAKRELQEETGVRGAYMEQLYTFSEPSRDPRMRIISASYMALLNKKVPLKAETDAVEVAWFKIDYKKKEIQKKVQSERIEQTYLHTLILTNEQHRLQAEIMCKKTFKEGKFSVTYEVINSEGIAFDHAKIISFAIERLRGKMEYTDMAFYLLPEFFTLKDLQGIHELILDTKLIDANFRRKIGPYVIATENMQYSGSRKAKLFKRNLENLI